MDPVGIAGTAIAVATLCAQAGILCNKLLFRKHDIHRTLVSLRTEITANQVALHTIQELLLDQEGPLARSIEKSNRWSTSFDTALGACELTISLLIEQLQKAIESCTEGTFQLNKSFKYAWKEHMIENLTTELRGQNSAVQALIQTLQLRSVADVLALLDKEQHTFAAVKEKAESHVPHSEVPWDPNARAIDVFSILDCRQDDKVFDFDGEITKSGPYRTRQSGSHQVSPQKPLMLCLLDNDLLDLDDDKDAPGDNTPGRYLQELQDAFSQESTPCLLLGPETLPSFRLYDSRGETLPPEASISAHSQSSAAHDWLESPVTSSELFTLDTQPSIHLQDSSLVESENVASMDGVTSSDVQEIVASDSAIVKAESSTTDTSAHRDLDAIAEIFTSTPVTQPKSPVTKDPWSGYESRLSPQALQLLMETASLHYAAYTNDVEDIKRILSPSNSIRAPDTGVNALHGYTGTAISYASRAGHTSAAETLLALGADPSLASYGGMTAFHWAVICSKPELFVLLLPRARDLAYPKLIAKIYDKKWSFQGWNLMSIALYFGNESIVQAVASSPFYNPSETTLSHAIKRLPLHSAVASLPYLLLTSRISHHSAYKAWCDARYDPFWLCRQSLEQDWPDLWYSSKQERCITENLDDRLLMTSLLVTKGFKIGQKDPFGFTPLQAACCGVSDAIIERLLLCGAKQELRSETLEPVKTGRLRNLLSRKRLVPNYGIDASCLHLAAFWNRASIIRILVREGADPNVAGYARRTPLHYAAAMGNLQAIYALLSLKANVDAGTCHGLTCPSFSECNEEIAHTPLSLALDFERLDAMSLLIKGGANVKKAIYNMWPLSYPEALTCKETILHRAARSTSEKSADIIALLIKKGADPNAVDSHKWTPLHAAMHNGNALPAVQMLLLHGADPNLRTDSGWTPLWLAIYRGSLTGNAYDVVEALLTAGADAAQMARDLCTEIEKKIQKNRQGYPYNPDVHHKEDFERIARSLNQLQITVGKVAG